MAALAREPHFIPRKSRLSVQGEEGQAGRFLHPLPPDWPLTGARCHALWASVSPPVRSEKDGPDWAGGSQPSHAQGAPLLLLVACSWEL